jgi:hypothetical protein
MLLPQSTLVCLAAMSTSAYAERLKAVFSTGTFNTIFGPSGGSVSTQYTGFAICCEYASAVSYSLLNGRKQRVLYQGLCNQHLMIRWYDQPLLVITTKEGRGHI